MSDNDSEKEFVFRVYLQIPDARNRAGTSASSVYVLHHRQFGLVHRTSNIELIVEQPQDSCFDPDAYASFPYGWYGRAACLLVADNLFGHQVIAYGVVADFIVIRGGLKVWVTAQVLASTATGWHIQPSIGERLSY